MVRVREELNPGGHEKTKPLTGLGVNVVEPVYKGNLSVMNIPLNHHQTSANHDPFGCGSI